MIEFTPNQTRNIVRSIVSGIWIIIMAFVYSISTLNKSFEGGIMPQVWQSEKESRESTMSAINDMREEVDNKLKTIKPSCLLKTRRTKTP